MRSRATARRKFLIAVTPGDPEGIGPEIVWKALRRGKFPAARASLLCVGARAPFERLGARIIEADETDVLSGRAKPPRLREPFVWLLPAPEKTPASEGRSRFLPGYQSGWSIEKATRLVQSGTADAIVTGPISKERLQRGGYAYPGHTEFLAKLCGVPEVTMMLANEKLRVTLVTTHLGLKDVSPHLTRKSIRRCVTHTQESLRQWWGIKNPRIAVCGLNPHAGESGIFGNEEIRIISPVLEELRRATRGKCRLEGPLPADTLFAKHMMAKPGSSARYDAVVCMYHDQGLIPVKLVDFPNTVNVTLGLPIVRTSVDHGVGFDIAGRGIADPSSLESAIRLAIHISDRRARGG